MRVYNLFYSCPKATSKLIPNLSLIRKLLGNHQMIKNFYKETKTVSDLKTLICIQLRTKNR